MKMFIEMAREGEMRKREGSEGEKETGGGASSSSSEEKEGEKKDESKALDKDAFPVDQYFIFFLKFIATICPV